MTGSGGERTDFLELRGLGKRFGTTEVLDDISLGLPEGEILALLGPSGSGKTTVLRLLAGFESADRGEIRVSGQEVSALPPARRRVGMVFQHYALFPHMTVAENVAFGLESQGLDRPAIAVRVAEMLELVDLPSHGGRRVSEISGGQQQRVALARALAPEPRLLLLDEPLSNLDPALRERTRRELRTAVRRVGITTVLVTHEQEEAFDVGDRVAVLHRGRLEQIGRPETLYREPQTPFVATFVGHASTLRASFEEADDTLAWASLEGLAAENAVAWSGQTFETFERGEPVSLVVRPESLRLVTDGTPGAVAGKVIARRFTGPLTYALIRLGPGETSQAGKDMGDKAGGEAAPEVEVLIESSEAHPGDLVWVAPRESGLAPRLFHRAEPAS